MVRTVDYILVHLYHIKMYIVLEGIIGTGKTTQSKKLAEYLKQKFPEKEIKQILKEQAKANEANF